MLLESIKKKRQKSVSRIQNKRRLCNKIMLLCKVICPLGHTNYHIQWCLKYPATVGATDTVWSLWQPLKMDCRANP